MTKHTPTPWATQRGSIVGNGEEVAVLGQFDDSPSEWDLANAKLIVRAVNSHDELIAVIEELDNKTAGSFDKNRMTFEWCVRARDAIRKARGE